MFHEYHAVAVNIEDNEGISMIQHMNHVQCTGQESRLMDCSYEGIGEHTCGGISNRNAAVLCSGEGSTMSLFYNNLIIISIISVVQEQTIFSHDWNVTDKSFIIEFAASKNSSADSTTSLTNSQIWIMIGSTSCGAILLLLLTVVTVISIAVGYVRKKLQRTENKSRYKVEMCDGTTL